MTAEKFRQVTDATQADFLAHQQEVLSEHVTKGDHPNSVTLRRLLKLWQKNGTPEKLAHLNRSAMSYSPLSEIVGQYIDPSGEPKAAVLENGAVKRGDALACFGRQCGFQELCWTDCSLGPSRHNNGAVPEGAVEGSAVPTHPKGYAMGDHAVNGVLCQVPDPQTGAARHRSNACVVLSTFQHVFAIPPAPTGSLADTMFDQIGPTLDHVENRMEAEKVGATAPPQTAPPQAAPPSTAPPVASAPPAAPTGAPPAVPPSAPPPTAPAAVPPSAPPPPPAGMVPTVPPTGGPPATPPPVAPPATQQPDPAEQEAPAPEVNAGPNPNFFDSTTIEQEWELRALKLALENYEGRPAMTINTLDGVISRNSDTYKKLRAALFKACASRDMTTGSSLVKDRLKKEFWGEVQIPEKYFDEAGGVPETTSEAPPAVQPPPGTVPVAPPPSGPPTVAAIKAEAPEARQRIDEDQDEPPPPEPPKTEGEARMEKLEAGAEEAGKLREALTDKAPNHAAQAQASEEMTLEVGGDTIQVIASPAAAETMRKYFEMSPEQRANLDRFCQIYGSSGNGLADAVHHMAEAYRERTAVLAGDVFEPVEQAAKKPAAKKKSAAKKTTRKKTPPPAPVVEAHPEHPKVRKDPCPWQPGTRGRPPKDVKRHKTSNAYLLPKGWLIIDGMWHPPMPK